MPKPDALQHAVAGRPASCLPHSRHHRASV